MHTNFRSRIPVFLLLFLLFTEVPLSAQESEREVQIVGVDGMTLRGVYHEASGPGPGIVLLHQCDRVGMTTGYEVLATRLVDQGFHVLALDARASVRAAAQRQCSG
ncbi:MAG: hypothetical protein WEB33_01820 [Bacteroidota bacterium]